MPDRLAVIAVLNTKGGVGKTTTAVNLGAALAGTRRRVLLVDLDSQACASLWCGVKRHNLRPSAASCLLDRYPVLKAVRPTAVHNLDILTGSMELANVDVALAHVRGRELAVDGMLRGLKGHYDLVVLDGAPGMSLLTINALLAADAVIVPVVPEPLGIATLGGMLATIERARARMRAHVRLLGLLVTMTDSRRKHMREIVEALRSERHDAVFHTEIRWTAALANGSLGGSASDAYHRLGGEVLQRLATASRS